jgi:hypothetical protein
MKRRIGGTLTPKALAALAAPIRQRLRGMGITHKRTSLLLTVMDSGIGCRGLKI